MNGELPKDGNISRSTKLKHNILLLALLTLSGSFIYSLPYFRLYYYDAFLETFLMTNTEAGLCGTFYGVFGAFSYIVGGVLADRFPIRWLLSFSLVTTGITGFYLLTLPSPFVVALVHGLWGVTSLMTFWPALLKAIRLLAASNEQGKAFGFFEGGRGICNAVYMGAAVMMFSSLTAKGGNILGIKGLIIAYSAVTTMLGVILVFLLRNIRSDQSGNSHGFNIKDVGKILSMPTTWLMISIIFCTYSINMSFYYVSPYTTAAFGTSTVFAAALATMSQYVRPMGAISAGLLGDRLGNSKTMLTGQCLMLIGLLLLVLTPIRQNLLFIIIISCIFLYISMYACQSMHFAIMEEGDYPPEITGTAVGLVCFLGYLPESICPLVAGMYLDRYDTITGYHAYFMLLLGVCATGIAMTMTWIRLTRAKRARILMLNKLNNKAYAGATEGYSSE